MSVRLVLVAFSAQPGPDAKNEFLHRSGFFHACVRSSQSHGLVYPFLAITTTKRHSAHNTRRYIKDVIFFVLILSQYSSRCMCIF